MVWMHMHEHLCIYGCCAFQWLFVMLIVIVHAIDPMLLSIVFVSSSYSIIFAVWAQFRILIDYAFLCLIGQDNVIINFIILV